jgi:hypothetical protein
LNRYDGAPGLQRVSILSAAVPEAQPEDERRCPMELLLVIIILLLIFGGFRFSRR